MLVLMKKTLVIAAVALLVLIGGGVYVYTSDAAVFDGLYSPDEQQVREARRFVKELPPTIGTYTLQGHYANNAEIRRECSAPDGLSFCDKVIATEYRETNGTQAVFVHFLIIESGVDAFRTYIAKGSRADSLLSRRVLRFESHELGWIPAEKYDLILTQEALDAQNDRGTTDYSYPNQAKGDNPVTRYFLEKYPPGQ